MIRGLPAAVAACSLTFAAASTVVLGPFGSALAGVPGVGDVVPLEPARLMDTRDETGAATVDGIALGGGAKPDGTSTALAVSGRGGVPDDAIAVLLNVTAVAPTAPGYLTLSPCDAERPVASNVNYAPGDVVANLVFAKVAGDGTVCVFNRGSTHVVVDVNGYVPSGGGFVAVAPQRFFESRQGAQFLTFDHDGEGGGRVAAGAEASVRIAGRGSVPANVTSVMLNVTVVGPSGAGHVTVYPCGTERPLASNLNYVAGDVVANAVFARVNPSSNDVCISSHADTDLVVDVTGYVAAGVDAVGASAPRRLLDTRGGSANLTVDHLFEGAGPLAGGSEVELVVAGRGGVPGAAAAVFLNVTAVAATGPGHLTVYPCGTARPLASNLNYTPGAVVPNAVVAKVGAGGKVCIYTKSTTHLVVDANGFALAPTAPPPTTTCVVGGATVATSIPQVQCDALVAFYDSTGGPAWTTRTGWLTPTDPCTWHAVTCAGGGVTELDFYNNNLDGPLPPAIGDLTDLEYLVTWVNQLTSVPAEIGNLTALRTLVLGSNPLADLPAELWTLTALERLELSYVNLTAVPPAVGGLVNLKQLDISGNGLTSLPTQLTTLTSLRALDVAFNALTGLPAGFGSLALEELDLSANPIAPATLPSTLATVTSMTTLTRLELFGLGITALPASIGDLVALEFLSVEGNQLTALPATLYDLPLLNQLSVTGNQLAGLDLALADLPALTYLSARNNPWALDLTAPLQALKDTGAMIYVAIRSEACPMVMGSDLQAWVASFDPNWNTGCP